MPTITYIEIPFRGTVSVPAPTDLADHQKAINRALAAKAALVEAMEALEPVVAEFGQAKVVGRRVAAEPAPEPTTPMEPTMEPTTDPDPEPEPDGP